MKFEALKPFSAGMGLRYYEDFGIFTTDQDISTDSVVEFAGVTINGTVEINKFLAVSFPGDGSKLSNVKASSIDWSAINDIEIMNENVSDNAAIDFNKLDIEKVDM